MVWSAGSKIYSFPKVAKFIPFLSNPVFQDGSQEVRGKVLVELQGNADIATINKAQASF